MEGDGGGRRIQRIALTVTGMLALEMQSVKKHKYIDKYINKQIIS